MIYHSPSLYNCMVCLMCARVNASFCHCCLQTYDHNPHAGTEMVSLMEKYRNNVILRKIFHEFEHIYHYLKEKSIRLYFDFWKHFFANLETWELWGHYTVLCYVGFFCLQAVMDIQWLKVQDNSRCIIWFLETFSLQLEKVNFIYFTLYCLPIILNKIC